MTDSVQMVAENFHVTEGKDAELAFIEKYKSETSPSKKAYVIAIEMKQAEHAFSPMTKIRIFSKSKSKLENLIKSNGSNIHAKYVRVLIQDKTPSFLGYNDDIMKDKVFLKNKIADKTCPDYLVTHIKKNISL